MSTGADPQEWPALQQLLAQQRTVAGAVTVAAVDALRATLRACLAAAPGDPGVPAGTRLLADLDALRAERGRDEPVLRLRPAPAEAAPATGLAALAAELAKSPVVEDYAPGAAPRAPAVPATRTGCAAGSI
ncbi:hypothetical protein V2W30_33615 [Streptomyces sp. Q6]|uniref:Uncharacterized protein n=1 Tax=Streptomyces citrinus TaxID=3118173 RepID=A0ACD5AKS1_9ACTN